MTTSEVINESYRPYGAAGSVIVSGLGGRRRGTFSLLAVVITMKGKLETGTVEPTDILLNDANQIRVLISCLTPKGARTEHASYGNGPWFRCSK